MFSEFTIWQVTPEVDELCRIYNLERAIAFIEKLSARNPASRFDLRVVNDNGEENLGVFQAGKMVGLDGIGE